MRNENPVIDFYRKIVTTGQCERDDIYLPDKTPGRILRKRAQAFRQQVVEKLAEMRVASDETQ